MPEPSQFRHYQIIQDAGGNHVELIRDAEQVTVLAFDTRQVEFVQCHVLLEPLTDRRAFEEACRRLQQDGHPLLTRLVEFGEDEGNPFYITANVDGESVADYLKRQPNLPVPLALMLAARILDAALAASERGHCLTRRPLNSLRLLQQTAASVYAVAADFCLTNEPVPSGAAKAHKQAFEKQAKALKTFAINQAATPDRGLPAAEFASLLEGCLAACTPEVVNGLRDLRQALTKIAPAQLPAELPSALKPRALLASLLASHQEVARGVVNLVRIQSQRLDAANPYAMRGTLIKTGRGVIVEQVPPRRLSGEAVEPIDRRILDATQTGQFPNLIRLVLVKESDGVTCLVEEVVDGIALTDLLRERPGLDVDEAYVLLASLESALEQLERAHLGAHKLRLEDIFLLTGFSNEDGRGAKLLAARLTEWPSFSVVVRAHPTLAAMAGRGTNPASLLPHGAQAPGSPSPRGVWHAGWMAALGRFLLHLEPLPGSQPGAPGSSRERDAVTGLLDEEIARCRAGKPGDRGDFLNRYARIVQQLQSKLKKIPAAAAPAPVPAEAAGSARHRPLQKVTQAVAPNRGNLPPAPPAGAPAKPTVGFAEVLFQGAATDIEGAQRWLKTAADAPPTIHVNEALLPPRDYVPIWLRASVFIGGSMVAGAILAHLSGRALWQKETNQPSRPAVIIPAAPAPTLPVPGATAPRPSAPEADSEGPLITPPVNAPRELPPEPSPPSGNLLKPPAGLKDQIANPAIR